MSLERTTIRTTATFIAAGIALATSSSARQERASEVPGATVQDPAEVQVPLTWGDVDGDSLPDALAVLPNGALRLFRNAGDGTLAEITQDVGLLEVAATRSALLQDLNGDGLADLLISGAGGTRLLACSSRGFVDITEGSGLGELPEVYAASALDYDADGVTDLLVRGSTESSLLHGTGAGVFERVELPLLAGEANPGTWSGLLPPESPEPVPGTSKVPAPRPWASRPDKVAAGSSAIPGSGASSLSTGGHAGGSTVPAAPPVPVVGDYGCLPTIMDQAGGCLMASSVPTLGSLYPLSTNLNVDSATGYVGMGTTTPLSPLTVRAAGNGIVQWNDSEGIIVGGYAGLDAGWYGTYSTHPLSFFVNDGLAEMTIDLSGSVGIGTNQPDTNWGHALELAGTDTDPSTAILNTSYGGAPYYVGRRANGSPSTKEPVSLYDNLLWMAGQGYDGTNWSLSKARMIFQASEDWTPTAQGTEISFQTTANGTEVTQERMRITNDGSVVIGTDTPDPFWGRALEFAGTDTDPNTYIINTSYEGAPYYIARRANGIPSAKLPTNANDNILWMAGQGYDGTNWSLSQARMVFSASEDWTPTAQGTEIRFATTPTGTTDTMDRMLITNDGRIGIGTSTPVAKVEISGSVNYFTPPFGLLNNNATVATSPGGFYVPMSLLADGWIGGSVLAAFSDARIKNVEGRSDSAQDLETLMGLEITDYHYIDAASKGAGPQKKVVAQQVESVFPQAVSRSTNVVPDIFARAPLTDGWVALDTDLAVGDRVRLDGPDGRDVYEVLEVAEGRFRTAYVPEEGDEVFVYGREVNDFRSVDYDALAMLDLSATQELARRLEAKDAEIAALTARLAALEARDQERETRLARIEAALGGQAGSGVVASR